MASPSLLFVVEHAILVRWRFRVTFVMVLMVFTLVDMRAQAQHTYIGMDRNDYPGDANMASAQEVRVHRILAERSSRRQSQHVAGQAQNDAGIGYGFLLLFNGREYAQLKASGNAARVGTNDAVAAVRSAQQEGFPHGAIIFLDQEQGGRMLPEQRAYIHAWVDGVTRGGYRAGVYCSGIPFRESATVSVVTANDIRDHSGGRQIHFFVSNDQCPPSAGCVFPQTAAIPGDSGVQFADAWQFAQSPRRPAMTAACRQSYAQDGNCYSAASGVYVDVDSANSGDPSRGRTR